MSIDAWIVFALFWVVFVSTPGPNAVNCISNGMTIGFRRSVPGILAILTQASLFLGLSAAGVTVLIAASPEMFHIAKFCGAGFLIYLGVRGWVMASVPPKTANRPKGSIYFRALAIAVINPKSVAGYFAAFTQFVQTDVPLGQQMWVIVPTALTLTALSYTTYTTLGALIGKAALGVVFHTWFRRLMAACFVIYRLLLGIAAAPERG